MKKLLIGFWYSLPIQLFLLHFRRYQIFLVFWYILFATVGGSFMESFGACSLYLAPEYYNEVNFFSTAIVGGAIGIFIMSWHITTFILHRKHIQFLATTAQPFLKFCINNSIMPLIFLLYYFFTAIDFDAHKELMNTWQIIVLVGGFLVGLFLSIAVAFIYFFGADRTIYKSMQLDIHSANDNYKTVVETNPLPHEKHEIRIDWFLSAKLHLRKPRDIRHYSQTFLDSIFKRHHLVTVIAFFIAFIFLVGIGFTADSRLFQIPAAASITILFALLIAVGGAFSVFLKSWSIPLVMLVYLCLNYLYEQNIINPTNKAYGINYWNKEERPSYNRESLLALASNENMAADKKAFLQRLNAWKVNQKEEKPILYIVNTSGGGVRSATFTFNVLQRLDSLMQGDLMKKTLFINGASGGLLGAAYYRELYHLKLKTPSINLQDKSYIDDISKDLLNPLFSSFVSRDIIGPVQKFAVGEYEYIKDRGYAFEQKLHDNTNGCLNKSLKDYTEAENKALIPTMLFNSVVSRDGRKMIMCTQPVRFLMKPATDSNKIVAQDPDAIDFNSFFAKQNSTNIRISSALRMNATFPYVLPNVWLPTNPVIDVMDAGIRDNFGQESTLRFIEVFKDWLKENTSKVVIIQIRDRSISDWDKPYESKTLVSMFTKPAFLLQYNWFKLQDYYQNGQLEYLSESYGKNIERICFQYVASAKDKAASLSFHLTAREKAEIAASLKSQVNNQEFGKLKKMMN
jgi:hypothetical protein